MNNNWTKLKRSTVKTTKKKPAKYGPSFAKRNPVLSKLLDLKYRISQERQWYDQRDSYTKADKSYVMSLITDIRKHKFTKLAPEDGHCCNGLWRKYEG